MERMRKEINMQILIVTMLIITISSVVSTVLMYKLLMDTKYGTISNISVSNRLNNNSKDKTNEEETVENSFATYQKNYQKSLKEIMEIENEISIYLGDERKYELPGVQRVYVDVNNDAYFEFKKGSELYVEYGEKLKVESDVANVFVYPTGSGGYSEAIFLKLDGTASSVHGADIERKVVDVKKVEGVKNAVSVISYDNYYYNEDNGEYEGNTPDVAYIDINGNVIK